MTRVNREILERLKANDPSLTSLDLSLNEIGAEGARELAGALRENSSLTKLDLEGNNIGAEGARELAGALRQNSSLTSLDLRFDNIGAEGARALAATLRENSSLTSLDLSLNEIGAEGARELAHALRENSSLTSLDLVGNNIGDEGARELAATLRENSSLTSLSLGYNRIGEEGKAALTEITGYLTRNINNKIAEANALYEQAAILLNSDLPVEVEQSVNLLDRAIKLVEQVKAGSNDQGNELLKSYLFSKARTYNLLEQYDQALKLLDKALGIDNNYQVARQYKEEVVKNKATWLAKPPIQEESKESLPVERGLESKEETKQEQQGYRQLDEEAILRRLEEKLATMQQQLDASSSEQQARLKESVASLKAAVDSILQHNPQREQAIQQLTEEMTYLLTQDELNTDRFLELIGQGSEFEDTLSLIAEKVVALNEEQRKLTTSSSNYNREQRKVTNEKIENLKQQLMEVVNKVATGDQALAEISEELTGLLAQDELSTDRFLAFHDDIKALKQRLDQETARHATEAILLPPLQPTFPIPDSTTEIPITSPSTPSSLSEFSPKSVSNGKIAREIATGVLTNIKQVFNVRGICYLEERFTGSLTRELKTSNQLLLVACENDEDLKANVIANIETKLLDDNLQQGCKRQKITHLYR